MRKTSIRIPLHGGFRFTSFDFMSMLGELEEEFDIEVDEQEAPVSVQLGSNENIWNVWLSNRENRKKVESMVCSTIRDIIVQSRQFSETEMRFDIR